MTLKEYKENPTNLAAHILRHYVPLAEKRTAAEIVARVSCYDKDGNFRQDSVERYVWERIMVLDLYTDFERSEDMYADFDMANESGLFKGICEALPSKELSEWSTLVELCCADAEKNEYEIGGFLRRQVERFGQLVGVGLGPVAEQLKELDWEKLGKVLETME